MKREGRIHGCRVRLGKRAWGDGGYRGRIAFIKPTNQSKSTMKYSIPSGAQIVANEHELPMQKSIGKIKNAFKAKDLETTRNHPIQDWKIYKRGLPVEANYCDEGSDDYREHWTSDESGNDGHEEEDEADDEDDHGEDSWDAEYRARSLMVLPIESPLKLSKGKNAPAKANTFQQQPRRQPHLTLADAVGVAEIMVEGLATDDGNNTDQFESWWGLGFYDEEEVLDDWFLITEGEDFLVPA